MDNSRYGVLRFTEAVTLFSSSERETGFSR